MAVRINTSMQLQMSRLLRGQQRITSWVTDHHTNDITQDNQNNTVQHDQGLEPTYEQKEDTGLNNASIMRDTSHTNASTCLGEQGTTLSQEKTTTKRVPKPVKSKQNMEKVTTITCPGPELR